MIVIERAPPLLTVQDSGRSGYFADGVTQSGPLDPLAHAVGNALVGNDPRAALLEACLGGGQFRFEHDCTFSLTGAELEATLNGTAVDSFASLPARAGDVLLVERVVRGAVWYLTIRGGIDVPLVLGSRSTLLAAALGGAGGAPVKTGQRLLADHMTIRDAGARVAPATLRTALDDTAIPLTIAPRSDALEASQWDTFYETRFTVSHAMSRIGYRLDGARFSSRLAADLASEPACRGAMQLPPEGQPIVLMADHPTIGGYPIIGVVPACAIGRFAQRSPGSSVRFVPITLDAAVAASHEEHGMLSKWVAVG